MAGAAQFTIETPPPTDGSTRARTARLTLTHGDVETPQFMPVGTNATVKALTPASQNTQAGSKAGLQAFLHWTGWESDAS